MKELFRLIREDKILFRGTVLSLALILLAIISIIIYYGSLPPFIPLFNQMPWGEQRITKTIWIFLVPSISLLFFLINLILAKNIYRNIPLIARLFSFANFLIAVLAFLFVLRTIHTVL